MSLEAYEETAKAFYEATGKLMPGKDGCDRDEEGNVTEPTKTLYRVWCAAIEHMAGRVRASEAAAAAIFKKFNCDECGDVPTHYRSTEGDGAYWFCDKTDEAHSDERYGYERILFRISDVGRTLLDELELTEKEMQEWKDRAEEAETKRRALEQKATRVRGR